MSFSQLQEELQNLTEERDNIKLLYEQVNTTHKLIMYLYMLRIDLVHQQMPLCLSVNHSGH